MSTPVNASGLPEAPGGPSPAGPPGKEIGKHIAPYAHRTVTISPDALERSLFDKVVMKDGAPVVTRPKEYDPPAGWKSPNPKPPLKLQPRKTDAPKPEGG